MKTYLTLLFAFLLLCTGAGAALASTPDGQTPAEETVCDDETGAAYGLCNAYCEAMDCESDNPHASATACTRVRDKFQQITGRDLPCEAPPIVCPCQIFPEFAADLAGLTTCSSGPGGQYAFSDGSGPSSGLIVLGAFSSCDSGSNGLALTAEEGAICLQLLLDTAASRGVTCN